MGMGKTKNDKGEFVDKENIHILLEIDGTEKVLITGAYRIVTTFKYLINKNDIGAIVGTPAIIYQVSPKEGYNIRTAD